VRCWGSVCVLSRRLKDVGLQRFAAGVSGSDSAEEWRLVEADETPVAVVGSEVGGW
jgi:hypothetical protein